MSGKSIKEMLEKIEMEKSMKISREREEDKKIFEIREKARQEYLKRNKMYENISYNQNLNSVSSGGRAKGISKIYVYITNGEPGEITSFYKQDYLDYILNNHSDLYLYKTENTIYFEDVFKLQSLYDLLIEYTAQESSSKYTFGVGTRLKDLESSKIFFKIENNTNIEYSKKIIEFTLIEQITPQSELDNPGSSEDGSIGYIVTYSDWLEDSSIDVISDLNDIQNKFDNTNFDIRTVDGPFEEIL